MAAEQTSKTIEAYPMKGGDGVHSYANNSSYQREVIGSAKRLITEAIAEKLDVDNFVSSYTYRIADLGCSVGPNTFFAVQNIIEALQFKHQRQGLHSQLPEFQIFFNDHILNDFNTLFSSLPPNREYYAAGVPVPKPVVDKSSPAWNKGRIHYPNSNDEVVKAYQAQHTEDMECFLHARAKEVVCGGLVALIILGRPNGMLHSQSLTIGALESCLMDMARKGIISEEKLDSFNLPLYCMSPQELEAAVDRNGYFSVERIITELGTVPETQSQKISSNFRAAFEGVIMAHFGYEILDELFDSFGKKFEVEFMTKPMSGSSTIFFALLKRKATS
ncbi:hypothetical protein ACB098_04G072200 [Castanea mollissima]